jgi:hypothetical protein
LLRRGRRHPFDLLGLAARWAAWQCTHRQRECSALKSVKGPMCLKGGLSRFSPSLRSGARASPIMRTPRGSGQCGRPKHMKIASQLIVGSATIHVFWSCCPGPQAAERECSALGNVKGSCDHAVRLSRFSPELRSGVGASPTMRTTRKPYKALRRYRSCSANLIGLSVDVGRDEA